MFLGCFVQFPPISDVPLYTINIKPISSFTKQTQKKNMGKSLWENYMTPIKSLLTQKKMRQNKYIQYV